MANGTPAGATYTNATTATIDVAGITAAGSYQYRVYITNCSGADNATSAAATFTVNDTPAAPTTGTITQPTCALATGSVVLNGLPATGTWTIASTPAGIAASGTGTTTTVPGVAAGTYTVTVTNASGCTSPASANIVLNASPSTPTAPTAGTITQPTCALATGSVVLNGLPATGTWTIASTPAGISASGTGTTTTVSGIAAGTYTVTVTNASGCTSVASANIAINAQPSTPTAPTAGTITQPTCALATGSVVLNGLPATGTWTIASTPAGIAASGTGTITTVSGIAAGTYTVTVTNASGCISPASSNIVINPQPSTPTAPTAGTITQPTCALVTGSVVLNGLPATGTWTIASTPAGIAASGTGTTTTVSGIAAGTYTVTVTNASGCTSPASANIAINASPSTPTAPTAGTITQPTCALATGSVVLNGLPSTGTWTIASTPAGIAASGTGTTTTVSGVAAGTYTVTVTNASGCTSPASANIIINAQPSTPTAATAGTITQPTCALATGSVILNGLPASGTWTVASTPGRFAASGSGPTTTVSGIAAGTYTITVTNASGCTSPASANIVISAQPSTPTAPTVGTITQPTCALATGSVVLNGLPATGTWTVASTPAGIAASGSGITTTISGVAAGTYTVTVTNASGCTSPASSNIFINTQPSTPTAPTAGTITQPTCALATGSVVLNGLPATGTWTVASTPAGITTSGSGTTTTVSGVAAGTYTVTVTNASGCTSPASANIVINAQPSTPAAPTAGTITQPTCALATGSVVLNGLPATGTWTVASTPAGIAASGTEQPQQYQALQRVLIPLLSQMLPDVLLWLLLILSSIINLRHQVLRIRQHQSSQVVPLQ